MANVYKYSLTVLHLSQQKKITDKMKNKTQTEKITNLNNFNKKQFKLRDFEGSEIKIQRIQIKS